MRTTPGQEKPHGRWLLLGRRLILLDRDHETAGLLPRLDLADMLDPVDQSRITEIFTVPKRGDNNITVNIYLGGNLVWSDTRNIGQGSEDTYTVFAKVDWGAGVVIPQ